MLLKKEPGCRCVDGYKKIERICSGSFGSVNKVRREGSMDIFAMKRMNPSMCHDTNGFSILYIREVMILKQISHRNVIGLEEVVEGTEINDFFIVMEYCDMDLKTFLHKTGEVEIEVIRYITQEMLQGLVYLHGMHVIHRDLKPSNILLKADGGVKIADFGLARTVSGQMTNLVVTLWYRSAEILLGSETYDVSVDMWSVGCIVGEMLRGEAILPGEGEIDQLGKTFGLLGYPCDEDLKGLHVPHYKNIKRPEGCTRCFESLFSRHDKDAVALVENMLLFDPRKRPTASEALNSIAKKAGEVPSQVFVETMRRMENIK